MFTTRSASVVACQLSQLLPQHNFLLFTSGLRARCRSISPKHELRDLKPLATFGQRKSMSTEAKQKHEDEEDGDGDQEGSETDVTDAPLQTDRIIDTTLSGSWTTPCNTSSTATIPDALSFISVHHTLPSHPLSPPHHLQLTPRQSFARDLRKLVHGSQTPPPLSHLLQLHSSMLDQISTDSCNILLEYAYRISNLAAARDILDMMAKERIPWDTRTQSIVLQGVMIFHRQQGSKENRSLEKAVSDEDGQKSAQKAERRWNDIIRKAMDTTPMAHAVRLALVRGGPWRSSQMHKQGKVEQDDDMDARQLLSLINSSSNAQAGSSTRRLPATTIQGALSRTDIKRLLPSTPEEMTPDLYIAFLRYILASAPRVPPPNQALDSLLNLEKIGCHLTRRHILDLLHLYLHRRFTRSWSRLPLIKKFIKDVPSRYMFHPTGQTLKMALLSLRGSNTRAWRAIELMDYFRKQWGANSIKPEHERITATYIAQQKPGDCHLPARTALKRVARSSKTKPKTGTVKELETSGASLTEDTTYLSFLRAGQSNQKLLRARRRLVNQVAGSSTPSADQPEI